MANSVPSGYRRLMERKSGHGSFEDLGKQQQHIITHSEAERVFIQMFLHFTIDSKYYWLSSDVCSLDNKTTFCPPLGQVTVVWQSMPLK